jgi:hypothetical protein
VGPRVDATDAVVAASITGDFLSMFVRIDPDIAVVNARTQLSQNIFRAIQSGFKLLSGQDI